MSLNNIKDHLIGKKIYYLCADTHYYQYSTICIDNLQIEQYIVGTGGANTDELPVDNNYTILLNDITVKYIWHEQCQTNGFLVVSVEDDVVSTEFIDAYEKKYIKYKNKYLNLKKMN